MSQTGRSGYVQRDWNRSQAPAMYNSETIQRDFNIPAPRAPLRQPQQGPLKQINYLTNNLSGMKTKLEQKMVTLLDEKERRITLQERVRDLEKILENESKLRLACEKELSQCKDTIKTTVQTYEEAQMSALKEVDTLKKQLQQQSSANFELASKLRTQEETTKNLEVKLAEFIVQMAISKIEIPTLEEADTEMENVSKQTVSTKTETFASEKLCKLNEISDNPVEIVPDLPEPQPGEDAKTSSKHGSSLWRRFKKAVTPAHQRQNKREMNIQRSNIPAEVAEPGEFLQLEETIVEEVLFTGPEQTRSKAPSMWKRIKKCITPPRVLQKKTRKNIRTEDVLNFGF